MKKFKFILLVVVLTSGCRVEFKALTGLDGVDVRLIEQNGDFIRFSITNNSAYSIGVESMRHLFIERNVDDQWQRIPYVPCLCGTPCMEPRPTTLASGTSELVEWNYLMRRCESNNGGIPETVENRVEKGEYRLRFTLNPSEDGMRRNPEDLAVSFGVR